MDHVENEQPMVVLFVGGDAHRSAAGGLVCRGGVDPHDRRSVRGIRQVRLLGRFRVHVAGDTPLAVSLRQGVGCDILYKAMGRVVAGEIVETVEERGARVDVGRAVREGRIVGVRVRLDSLHCTHDDCDNHDNHTRRDNQLLP